MFEDEFEEFRARANSGGMLPVTARQGALERKRRKHKQAVASEARKHGSNSGNCGLRPYHHTDNTYIMDKFISGLRDVHIGGDGNQENSSHTGKRLLLLHNQQNILIYKYLRISTFKYSPLRCS